MVDKERVCVTGAGGYQASWLIKLLLSKGYMVHGTVRDPSDGKNAHLMKLENASENLQLFKADLFDYDGLYAAIKGCSGIFHVACLVPLDPVANPEELIDPAVKGTSNVLKASSAAKVKKFVLVSSIAAIMFNPNWPEDEVMDESCWSDKEFCNNTKNWYCVAKTEAEIQAWKYTKIMSGFNVVTVCPSVIIGPMLQTTINSSSLFLANILKDEQEMANNIYRTVVDVRDTAEALLLVYEKPEAEGRYICTSYTLQDTVDMFKTMYPNYNPPNLVPGPDKDLKLSSEKLQTLGWKYRPLEEILVDTVKSYQEKGILAEV